MNNRTYFPYFLYFFLPLSLCAQGQPLDYYFPKGGPYQQEVPTPEEHLGFPIGAWHVDHSRLHSYLQRLADASERVVLQEYGRSHEQRPLSVLIITAPENHDRLEEIKAQRQAWCDPEQKTRLKAEALHGVLYQGYTIHGNEPSGANAALLVAYYLAASESEEVKALLRDNVILLDACFNPDGMHRFAGWVNSNRSFHSTGDPKQRELNEPWPGGRTNHYWFDLNRDWLLQQQPESSGRLKLFHAWKPHILTDHHEMGSNATFFFMPGIQSRTNPLTPARNQELTFELADYHAAALDELGSLYYTEESFDDFYIGKGSTYPDVNGCVGILFEQAGSRGHYRLTDNGPLSFPFTIRNQVAASLSTLRGLQDKRVELQNYQRTFFRSALEEAEKETREGFVFQAPEDPERVRQFLGLLDRHRIRYAPLKKDLRIGGITFATGESYGVLLKQPQYRMVRGMFDIFTEFQDSLFYDVSAWTLPLAFNLQYRAVPCGRNLREALAGKKTPPKLEAGVKGPDSPYAYAFEWGHYLSPRLAWRLLENGYRLRVATRPFTSLTAEGPRSFPEGTIVLASGIQEKELSRSRLQAWAEECGLIIYGLVSGLTPSGIDLGSNDFEPLEKPRILLLAGPGVRSYDAGEIWHLLDQRYQMPATLVAPEDLDNLRLYPYNVIILPEGRYGGISSKGQKMLAEWIQEGGTAVALKGGVSHLSSKGVLRMEFRNTAKSGGPDRLPYAAEDRRSGAQYIGGAIFRSRIDLTHPLCFGYTREELPLFRRGTLAFKRADNPYADPVVYTDNPLWSGYTSEENRKKIGGSSALQVHGAGRGKVICFAQNPNFRAFWYGTNKLFANALFFGKLIDWGTVER